jgi:hypothetical protein
MRLLKGIALVQSRLFEGKVVQKGSGIRTSLGLGRMSRRGPGWIGWLWLMVCRSLQTTLHPLW